MATPIYMPKLGESIVEGTVARWLIRPGETVERNAPLLEISTDKIDTEVPAPAAGALLRVLVPEGQTVQVGAVLGYIGEPGEALEPDEPQPEAASSRPAEEQFPSSMAVARPRTAEKPSGRAFISPVVARMAAEHNIDLEAVPGTGLNGRITKKDVMAYLARRSEEPALPPAAPLAETVQEQVLEPLSAMRRAIAEHMVRSVATSPHALTVFEADMTAVVRHREAHKAAFAEKGINLTYTAYFVAAAAQALRHVPRVNSRYTDQGLLLQRRIHIAVAVALPDGLITPVIRDADERNLQGLARAVNDLAERARAGQLQPEEVQGGTFTITNHGVSGSIVGAPIINQPQAAILGVGAIVKRPVVRSDGHSLLPSADDAIVIRPMCYLSLAFDHRVLDGADADRFLSHIVRALEHWPAE